MSCPPRQATPYFLVGPERAGTTMLRLMLHRHPCIAWNSESEYFVDWVGDDGRFPSVDEFKANLKFDGKYGNDRIFAEHQFAIEPGLDYPAVVQSFLEQARKNDNDKPVIGATIHRNFDRVLHIWPDAKFVKITRDGRDVARSAMVMGWHGNVWAAADRWIHAEKRWEQLRDKLPADRWIEIGYEELCENPEAVLTRLCAFFGVTYDPVMLSYDKSSGYEYPDAKYTYQWKRKMTPREVQLVEARLGEMLTQRGYEPSGHPRLAVGSMRRKMLAWGDRIGRAKFRMRRFGLPLVASGFLARRLKIRPWEASVKAKMNAIVHAGLRR